MNKEKIPNVMVSSVALLVLLVVCLSLVNDGELFVVERRSLTISTLWLNLEIIPPAEDVCFSFPA